MNNVYIGIGSNVGDRLENISTAISSFIESEKFKNVKYSSIYETKPYGIVDQNNFFNAVISFETQIELVDLFTYTKHLEKKIGRKKRETWGPREIDLDIILFNSDIIKTERITIPHKDLTNRDFVLVPLLEIDETATHPVSRKPLKSYLDKLEDKYIINKIYVKFEK